MKHRILGYQTPPCHRRRVTAHECSDTLQHRSCSYAGGRGGGGEGAAGGDLLGPEGVAQTLRDAVEVRQLAAGAVSREDA